MKSEVMWCFKHHSVPMSAEMCPYGTNDGCEVFLADVTRADETVEPKDSNYADVAYAKFIPCECGLCEGARDYERASSVFDGNPDDPGYDEWA